MPKIDLSHFTSWCCCPLPPAHPDADNGSSVSQCLLWRAEHLRARHRTTFKPLSLPLFLQRLVSPTAPLVSHPSFFDCLNGFFFLSFLFLCTLCSPFPCSVLNLCAPLRLFLLHHSLSREINLPMHGQIVSLRACLLWSLLLLHLCLPCRHSPALHLQHWAFLCSC